MYKALIIDDETPSREAIRILGEWERLGVKEIREAADGRTGLEIAREWRPDLILVDMRMPEMDGVEFLRHAEEELPQAFTIVISGHNDFEFTRQAIKSRVVDYLLKPVIRHELNQALANALDFLETRRKRELESIDKNIALNMSLPKLKETIFLSMIEGKLSEHARPSSLKLIGADDPETGLLAAVLHLMNMGEVARSRFHRDGALLKFAVTNVINEIGAGGLRCFCFPNPRHEREIIAVFLYGRKADDKVKVRIVSFLSEACGKLREFFGIQTAAGVGEPAADAACLADSYESAVRKLQTIDILGPGEAIAAEPAAGEPDEVHSLTARIAMIRGALQDHNPRFVQSIAEDFLAKIRKSGRFSYGDAQRTLREFGVLLKDMALEMGVPPAELAEAGENRRDDGFDISGFEAFADLFLQLLNFYCEQARKYAKSFGGFHIRDIRNYIDEHYFEEIKISTFTERYFLSREYLMKLFKQEYGCGIYEYLLKVRMEKARELLLSPHLKIQNVSDMLGYKDKNYFSKAFKNYYGISPTDFRLQHAAEEGAL